MASRTMASAPSKVLTSASTLVASTPASRSSTVVRVALSSTRSATTIFPPSSPSLRAVARPMPWPAPVTMHTLSRSLFAPAARGSSESVMSVLQVRINLCRNGLPLSHSIRSRDIYFSCTGAGAMRRSVPFCGQFRSCGAFFCIWNCPHCPRRRICPARDFCPHFRTLRDEWHTFSVPIGQGGNITLCDSSIALGCSPGKRVSAVTCERMLV